MSNAALATTQTIDKFKQQYESNITKLEQAQKQLAQTAQRVQDQKALLMQTKLQEGAEAGKLIAPEAEQRDKAEQYLQKSAQRVRADIEKEEKARKEIDELVDNVRKSQLARGTSFENLSNKNLDSRSGVDAYGLGGGRAGAYGERRGVGALAKEPPREEGWSGSLVEHGARAAGVMPPQIFLPKVGKTLNFKKLGTDPVLTLYSKDTEAFVRIYTFLTLLALILLLAAAFVLKLSFFQDKSLKHQIVEGILLALAGYFCLLSVFVAVPVGCLSLLALILAKSRRTAIIST
jgi:prefoldin subunit 5